MRHRKLDPARGYLSGLRRATWRTLRNEKGVTGLETAIILIAFVVVASVFAFTVLSTGIFSSEQGKETVFAGLQEAQAPLTVTGQMTADRGDVVGTNALVKLKFVVTPAIGGDELNLTPPNTTDSTAPDPDANAGATTFVVMSYSDENQHIDDLDWTVDFIGKSNGDFILDEDEQAEITVWLHDYDGTDYNLGNATNTMYLTTRLGINTKFRVEIEPSVGAVMVLERTTPTVLRAVTDLN